MLSSSARPFARNARLVAARLSGTRSFHSPFAILGNSPLTKPPSSSSNVSPVYEKDANHSSSSEPFPSQGAGRTYVVSEPDASAHHYEVPSGAYPTSAPYVNFTATEAPNTEGAQQSSTGSGHLAHPFTTKAALQHAGGVGESSAVRFRSAPGEMGAKGGSHSGEDMMDKAGTTEGQGSLGERNPQPDGASAATYSKAGVDDAWKLRK